MKSNPIEKMKQAAKMLRAVAHPSRMQIAELLLTEKKSAVGTIQKKIGISQSLTSQHLGAMRRSGILKCDKEGNLCYYSLVNPRGLKKLLTCIRQCACPQ